MYDCGKATVSTRRDACIAVAPDVSVGPQEISNNLMYNPGRPVRVLYRRDWSEDFVKLKARYDDRVAANLLIDPLLRDTERADFNLRPGSPAIGAGRPVEVPGLAMPGAFRDVGAVQSPAGTAQGAVP
jgi:hypothetical protein